MLSNTIFAAVLLLVAAVLWELIAVLRRHARRLDAVERRLGNLSNTKADARTVNRLAQVICQAARAARNSRPAVLLAATVLFTCGGCCGAGGPFGQPQALAGQLQGRSPAVDAAKMPILYIWCRPDCPPCRRFETDLESKPAFRRALLDHYRLAWVKRGSPWYQTDVEVPSYYAVGWEGRLVGYAGPAWLLRKLGIEPPAELLDDQAAGDDGGGKQSPTKSNTNGPPAASEPRPPARPPDQPPAGDVIDDNDPRLAAGESIGVDDLLDAIEQRLDGRLDSLGADLAGKLRAEAQQRDRDTLRQVERLVEQLRQQRPSPAEVGQLDGRLGTIEATLRKLQLTAGAAPGQSGILDRLRGIEAALAALRSTGSPAAAAAAIKSTASGGSSSRPATFWQLVRGSAVKLGLAAVTGTNPLLLGLAGVGSLAAWIWRRRRNRKDKSGGSGSEVPPRRFPSSKRTRNYAAAWCAKLQQQGHDLGRLVLLYDLYREAIDALRAGRIRADHPAELADAIDDYVAERLMTRHPPSYSDDCAERAYIGALYRQAVVELRSGRITSRLEAATVAAAIERWVRQRYLALAGVELHPIAETVFEP